MTAKTFEAVHKESFSGEYNLFLPDGYTTNNQYPLLVYLHGYYGEYISPDVMTDNIPDGLKENSNKYQFILACPLCPFEFYWRTTYVFSFINHLIETYDVDDRKTFLSGTSMGGVLGPGLPCMNIRICLLVSSPFLGVCLKLISTNLIGFNIFQCGLFTIEGTK